MSFQVFWDTFDQDDEERLRSVLASHFAAAKRPPFLGEVHLDELRFGAVPPEVEVLNVTDPFPEFYLPQGPAEGQENCEAEAADAALGRHLAATERHLAPEPCLACRYRGDLGGACLGLGSLANTGAAHADNEPDGQEWRPQFLEQQIPARSHSFPAQATFAEHNAEGTNGSANYGTSVESRSSSDCRRSNIGSEPLSPYFSRTFPKKPQNGTRKASSTLAANGENDAQVLVRFTYDGNLRLSLRTELKVDYPGMPDFMALPVRLTVTGAQVDATAVIAHTGGRASFCFLPPEDNHGSIVRDVRIQSELGDESKAVLKNVDKIERFIIEQLRKAIDDNLVFPAYHSIPFAL